MGKHVKQKVTKAGNIHAGLPWLLACSDSARIADPEHKHPTFNGCLCLLHAVIANKNKEIHGNVCAAFDLCAHFNEFLACLVWPAVKLRYSCIVFCPRMGKQENPAAV